VSDALTIPEERLRACLREQYGLAAETIERVPLGLDSTARVYRVVSATGMAYLLKARSAAFYEASCAAPRYLAEHAIAAVVAPLPTTQGALWTHLASSRRWVIAVYPFVVGVSGWRPEMSDAQWRTTGAIFRRIHDTPPPESSVSLRRETFEPDGYAQSLAAIEARQAEADDGTPVERALRERWRAQWEASGATIHALLSAMRSLATPLRAQASPLVICHADLHPGNLLRDEAGGVFVVDWDDVMLAMRERDFLFVGDLRANGAARADAAPFFQGYGAAEIDWVALTYYRCERIIQDVIECAWDALFRDAMEEGAREEAVALFREVVEPDNGMVDAVRRAAAQLPPGLSLSDAFWR
jgi:spectinomycin phosphotransferase